MIKLHNTIVVNASPDEAWQVLGDLAACDTWIPGVTSPRVAGNRRVCNDGQIEEEISDYSGETRSYRYRHLKTLAPIKNSSGIFAVDEQNGQSVVVWEWDFEALDPAQQEPLAHMMEQVQKQTLDSLKNRIEANQSLL
ncbi:MAG: SRPBCC family protein [Chloroflexi bacterium]|nr:SRPBCC family protein [Chloroflexota bacterium]MCI0580882.1 SRPBCC family protein [Chloroflexota bacterium]MCI0649730.1 SRPBCC family protein [Chloroflexota bacterium]MCI0725469.1 SRPBCC family protein [Chloroflexota bacterium]